MADLEREIETLAALREATRSAREAAKDLRGEVKAAREFRQEFLSTPELDARLGELTAAALASYDEGIKKAIDDATQAVWNRFDTITMIALGEDPQSVREGKKTIPDLLREFIAAKGLPYRLTRIKGEGGS